MTKPLFRPAVLAPALLALAACGDSPGFTEPTCDLATVSLNVGQTAWLSEDQAACFRLDGPENAAYALAYLDTRAVREAESAWERPGEGQYQVQVGRWSETGVVTRAAAPRPSRQAWRELVDDIPEPLFTSPPGGPDPHLRATPWTVGDTFTVRNAGREGRARVLRVYDGHHVVAWMEGDAPDSVALYLAQIDSAMPFVREHGLPLLRAAFEDRLPVTSTGSGQYLWLLRAPVPGEGIFASAPGAVSGDTVFGWIDFRLVRRADFVSMASMIVHEMAHHYQRMYLMASRPGPGANGAAQVWALEGGANLVSMEALRRKAQLPLAANFEWRGAHADPWARFYALRAQPGDGSFTLGYDNSAGFLRRLMIDRVAAGETPDQALREVSRGTMDGWYGHDGSGLTRPGLTGRMRARAGAAWSPADAVLTWTLSHAVDDRTPNGELQDRSFLRVWDVPDDYPAGWRADGDLVAGGARSASASRAYGSPGFVYLPAGDWRAVSSAGGVRYAVVRYQ